MQSEHLVDPQIRPLIDILPEFAQSDSDLLRVRETMATMTKRPGLPEPVIAPVAAQAPGYEGGPDVPLLLFDPPGRTARAAILEIHGGGMVMGDAAGGAITDARLAADLGVLVVAVDYRLAPEHPFPAPQQDCLAAYDWLVAQAERLNIDVNRIGVFGSSAGGGLAASLALMIRDLGRPAPAAQILIYPMLDYRTGGEQQPGLPYTGDFIWTREANVYGWSALRGEYEPVDEHAGWFSAALAHDVSRLAPTYIAVGALDLFVEEDLAYAQRLIAAGVPVELHLYPGAFHAFHMVPSATVSQTYKRDLLAGLRRLLGLGEPVQPG